MNYNLFGCPELPVWTVSPSQLTATHPASYSGGSLNVTVTAGGSPVSDARVTLYKGTSFQDADVYLVATTNSSGIATFSPSPSSTGVMFVTAWKYNHLSYLGSITVTSTSTEDRAEGLISVVTGIGNPHPSPAVSIASIPLSLDASSQVSLQVYDLSGRLVTTLLHGEMPAGIHNIVWNLTTASGAPVPNGSYRIRATAGDYIGTTSLMVLR